MARGEAPPDSVYPKLADQTLGEVEAATAGWAAAGWAAVLIGISTILGLPSLAFGQVAEPPSLEIQSASPSKGRYVVTASLQGVQAPPLTVAKAITDFPRQCKRGCAVEVPSIERAEIVHGSFEQGRMSTWTKIDDVLDASYWTEVSIHRNPQGIEINLSHPVTPDLERWQSKERPHTPFFHTQNVTWILQNHELGGTRIEYQLEMSSDRFLVNLMPSKVLKGAERYITQVLKHLATLSSG